jgi:hypothetical protein
MSRRAPGDAMQGHNLRGIPAALLFAAVVGVTGGGAAAVRASGQATPPAPTPAVTTESLLASAAAYVARFELVFSNVVAAERYVQTVTPRSVNAEMTFINKGGVAAKRRELVSDFLLVKLPDSVGWVPFRDVFEVDGEAVRDRDSRLVIALQSADESTPSRVRAILAESASYNIGVERTMNLPTLGLEMLHEAVQSRFHFSGLDADRSVGPTVYRLDFEEQQMPSMISGPDGRDLLARGQVWIDATDGTVLRTIVSVDDPMFIHVTVETHYQFDSALGVATPALMREEYTERTGRRTNGTATYSEFRTFGVSTTDIFRGVTK